MQKCDYCDNEASCSEIDPFEAEMSDYSDVLEPTHFCCDNLSCQEKYKERLYESAMDI